MSDVTLNDTDLTIRALVYAHFINTGRAPSVADMAPELGMTVGDVQIALRKLAGLRHLVLQSSGEVLMANPFSAVPTAYVVQTTERDYWGNCIWDAMGIPNMLGVDATINAACPDCGEAMEISVKGGRFNPAEGIVHFAVPARKWWEDIVHA